MRAVLGNGIHESGSRGQSSERKVERKSAKLSAHEVRLSMCSKIAQWLELGSRQMGATSSEHYTARHVYNWRTIAASNTCSRP